MIAFTHSGHDWIRGSERCLLDLVSGLDRERFVPLVVCDQPTIAREAAQLGAQVVRLERWGEGVLAPREVRRRLRAIFERAGASLVHANMALTLPAVIPAARRLRLPVVAHLHLPLLTEADRVHSLVHQATVVIGVAQHIVDGFHRDGLSATDARVVHNAVGAARMDRGDARPLRASLGIAPSAAIVTLVGSLISRKGHDVAIRALALARAAGHDVHALICGEGEADNSLQALAASLGTADAVHFVGFRSDVGAVLRDATDVYLSPAREEALPLNVLEAQWVGVPVIASAIDAHREAVLPGESALLVPADDPAALAAAIVELAGSPVRRMAMAAAGRRFARERFAMDRYVGSFAAVYDELLSRPRTAYGWVSGSRCPPVYPRWAARVVRRRLRLG